MALCWGGWGCPGAMSPGDKGFQGLFDESPVKRNSFEAGEATKARYIHKMVLMKRGNNPSCVCQTGLAGAP